MNDVDHSLQQLQMADHARRSAENWLHAFEAALVSRDAAQIAALFHDDCHWRDVLAFTWHFTAVKAATKSQHGLPQDRSERGRTGFICHPAASRPAGFAASASIVSRQSFEFATVEGRGAGIIRLSPTPSGDLKAWLISTTLEELRGHEEKIGDNRPTGAAYSRNFGGDNWDDMRQKARASTIVNPRSSSSVPHRRASRSPHA